ALLPDALSAVEIGGSWRHLETLGVLGAWAVAGLILAPIVLRRMARRESGSRVAERPERAMQRVSWWPGVHEGAERANHQAQRAWSLMPARSGARTGMSESIYNRIAMLRVERGITRRQLADALGVHYQTVGYLERGEFRPSLFLALKLAQYLKV